MRWLRLVGSLKSQVSFAEKRLFYRALLQKRPIILRSLLIVATPHRALLRKQPWVVCMNRVEGGGGRGGGGAGGGGGCGGVWGAEKVEISVDVWFDILNNK